MGARWRGSAFYNLQRAAWRLGCFGTMPRSTAWFDSARIGPRTPGDQLFQRNTRH